MKTAILLLAIVATTVLAWAAAAPVTLDNRDEVARRRDFGWW